MMDLCHTSIYLDGAETALKAVAAEIKNNGIDSYIFDSLDRCPFKENDSANYIEVKGVEIDGKPVLSVFVSTSDFIGTENWPEMQFDGAYYASHMIEAEEHITNDVEGRYFKPYCVIIDAGVDNERNSNADDEVKAAFWTEAEAVRFVKEACPSVPENLTSLDEIADYFFAYDFNTLYSMRHLVWHCCLKGRKVCQPVVRDIIQCLLGAIRSF